MKGLHIGVVSLLAAAFIGNAGAAPIPYDFTLDFTSGPLNHQHVIGVISIDGNDCPANKCVGTFDPTNPARTLLGLNVTVGGVPFSMTNDTGFGFGPFPDVTFNLLGRLTQIDFQGQTTFGGNTYTLDMTAANIGELAAFYQGAVGSPTSLVSVAVVGVPEPGTLPLLGLALIGAGFLVSRRSASNSAPKASLALGA